MITRADIQLVRSLADKRARTETGLFVAEGTKLVDEILRSPLHVKRVFAREGVFAPGEAEIVSPKEMERLSLLKTPSDAVAIVEIPRRKPPYESLAGRLTLLLDGVQNPGNLGTIIRLADWFGIADICCSPDSADCYNPKTVQASMGAILRVGVHYLQPAALLEQARAQNLPVYGTFLEGDDLYRAPLSQEGIIVMGSEGRGISPETERFVSEKLFIPSWPPGRQGSESLNVAIATAIVCAEFRRR